MNSHRSFRSAVALIAMIVGLLTIISTFQLKPIDKTLFDKASYILDKLPLSFYANFSLVIVAIAVSLIIGYLDNFSKITLYFYLFFALMYLLLLEFPRFLYPNAFQGEYFHQAQIYHVLNIGTVTDPGYISPKADVAHAIFGATFILVSRLPKNFTISHVLPIIVKLALLVIVCTTSISLFRTSREFIEKVYILLTLTLPLYVIVSDTEPLFINHYSYAMPLYALLLYEVLRRDVMQEPRMVRHVIILIIIALGLLITHLYYATLLMLTLFLLIGTSLLRNGRSTKAVALSYLSLMLAYFLWHAIASQWTMEKVKAELNILSTAVKRLVDLRLGLAKLITSVEQRFGSIPVKEDYLLYLKLKLYNIVILQVSVVILIMLITLVYSRNLVKELFQRDTTIFALLSAIFFFIYAGTYTAHPQRVLEHFVLSLSALVALVVYLVRKANKIIKVVTLTIILIIVSSLSLKLVHYWGTSLTYIGFPFKTVYMLYFLGKFTKQKLPMPIYYVGPNPYWFLTEIVSHKEHLRLISLNGPSNSVMFTAIIRNLNTSLNITGAHYIIIDLSPILSMRAKYKFEPYIDGFIRDLLSLASKANIVFNVGVTHMIWISGS